MTTRVEEFTEHVLRGLSKAEICELYPRLAPGSVGTYMRQAIADLTDMQREQMNAARAARTPVRHGAQRRFSERRSIGPVHVRIGRKLLAERQRLGMTHMEFSDFYSFANLRVLSEMEQGYHDFTVSQLLQLVVILKTSIEDLLSPSLGALAA